jgi:cyclopropane fatty-acyl-phospholipid synthase-like methyltransferase
MSGIDGTSLNIPFSQACERNKEVILDTIKDYLKSAASVLEIGSGTGQHALHFAQHNPHLIWQTSDRLEFLAGIRAQLANYKHPNILQPIELDVNQQDWVVPEKKYDIVYTANTFHIMRWQDVQAFFAGLEKVVNPRGLLIVYGPFKYQQAFTSGSNMRFDKSLRAGGRGSAIRDFEAVNELANTQGFRLILDQPMPANNQCLVWQRDHLVS